MGNTTSSGTPVAAIIAASVGSWTILILIVLGIRQFLRHKGKCENTCECAPCGTEDTGCCNCCITLSESTACGCMAGGGSCLDKICPNRKSVSCVDVLLCQCCGGSGNCFTNWCNECGTLSAQQNPR